MTDYKLICECKNDTFDRIDGKLICRKCGKEVEDGKNTRA